MTTTGRRATPLLQQWQEAKRRHPDAVVLMRVGDFYELLGPDAEVGVRDLGLALTGKGHGADQVPMAGVPARSRDEYAERLVQAGHRVAICEQMEDPREAQGTVRREVVEVLTPGVVLSDSLLSERRNNYLAALGGDAELALAAVDVTTGELFVLALDPASLEAELGRLEPAELLVPASWAEREIPGTERIRLTPRGDFLFEAGVATDEIRHRYGVESIDGFGLHAPHLVGVLGALLAYLREVRPAGLPHLRPPRVERAGDAMALDEMTVRNLELVEPLRREPGMKPLEGTLLGVIDETLTPMGARLLRGWLTRPLLTRERIEARLEAVDEFARSAELRRRARGALARVRDLERLAARLAAGRLAPREMRLLADSLARLPELREVLAEARTASLQKVARTLDPLSDLHERIDAALAPAPAAAFGEEEGVIRDGHDAALDELRALRDGATDWMARFQVQERQRTGIQHLKVGFHRTFGYYLEVPAAVADRVPEHYERRQTLASAERYATTELREWEARILEAEERIARAEQALYEELREAVAGQVRRVQDAALRVAMLDALAGLAECAVRRRYVRPEIHEGYALEIRGGRHPVVETMMPSDRFIPNDVVLDEDARVMILTGPNMSGKSTILRQVGIIQLLAQVGSFVPADSARLGLCDRVYTRVGASDNLVRGQSTFMVEALEVATILNGAAERSLVLMDEVGRGTSTWDGVSLAWAITEHLEGEIGAKTIFATHYHELTQLADLLPGVVNCNVAAREEGDRIVFLHRLTPGGADRSYGVEVARMAGVPASVVARAREILRTLEGSRAAESRVIEHLEAPPAPGASSAPAPAGPDAELAERVRSADLDRMTPLDALNLLAELKAGLREREE
jgi:DNA mismatch repair protein MutS